MWGLWYRVGREYAIVMFFADILRCPVGSAIDSFLYNYTPSLSPPKFAFAVAFLRNLELVLAKNCVLEEKRELLARNQIKLRGQR
ncbi:hypothetical protein SLE2022_214670 [Rubroshorea leprosula]